MKALWSNSRATLGLSIGAIAVIGLSLTASPGAQAIIALPGAAGLLAALWELVKASVDHQHRLKEQSAGNAFVLSATSHMAEKAFDMHVEFAEAYTKQTIAALEALFKKGPSQHALEVAWEMTSVRTKFTLWETAELAEFLSKFEAAIRRIGANDHLLENLPVGPERTALVNKIYDEFRELMGIENPLNASSPELAISNIVKGLRDHLGIPHLTKLRKFYLLEAMSRIEKADP